MHKRFPWKQAHWDDLEYASYSKSATPQNLLHFNEGSAITSQILEPSVEKRVIISQLWKDPWFEKLLFCSATNHCRADHNIQP